MDNNKKIIAFRDELNYIFNSDIRKFAEEAIKILPDYFFEIPASSTGKYHPEYSLNSGGLFRHTRAAVRIAIDLFRIDWWGFTDDDKDLIIVSLILHDGWKSGINKSEFTLADHPKIAKFALEKNNNLQFSRTISDKYFNMILNNIERHMGSWNRDYKTKQEIMPRPETTMEKFIHLADYLSSRKCLEMNFNVEIIRE